MKKALITMFVSVLVYSGALFAQETELQGGWYRYEDGIVKVQYFLPGKKYFAADIDLISTRPKTIGANTQPYEITNIGTFKSGTKNLRYQISGNTMILFEILYPGATPTPEIYIPIPQQEIETLQGQWIVYGDEFDIEVTVDAKTITVKKGKREVTYSYSSSGLPVITLVGSDNKPLTRCYFFFGNNTVVLTIPDDGTYILQRKN